MARTEEQIFNSLLDIKNNVATNLSGLTGISDYQDLLSQLNSDSQVANWALELRNQAVVLAQFELMIDDAAANIQLIKDQKEIATSEWIRLQVLNFQYGDVLQLVGNVPAYLSVDTTKRIIEFCSIFEESGIIFVKVRRVGSNLLSLSEFNGLYSYLEKILIAGSQFVIYNYLPDDIKLSYQIIYSGERGLDTIKANVETAITNYLSNLAFDAEIKINEITDALQVITGVIDARYQSISYKKNTDAVYVDGGLLYTIPLYAGSGKQIDFSTITYILG
jgi:hypothetical protein